MGIDFQQRLSYQNLVEAYNITMFSMWGIGVDLPRLLVRYAKSYPMVINIHCISMMIIGLMTLLYVIAKTTTFYSQIYPHSSYQGSALAEFILSWILCVCVLIQFILGFKLRYQLVSDKLSINMFNLKKAHKYAGTLMSVLGKIIVALQLQMYPKEEYILFRSWLFLIGALMLTFIILEVVYRIQTRTLMLKFPLTHQSKHNQYLQEICRNINNNQQDFPDYRQIGLRYLIIDNKMYYIDENFIHPGGEHIFTMYNGQQVNYLFKGTHFPFPDFPRHNHTKYATNYLEERLVGQIAVESILRNFNKDSQDLVQWKITAIEQMDGNTSFSFVEFQANDGYVTQNLNIESFGKYIMMSCPTQEIICKEKRPYSLIISLNNHQKDILHQFKQTYKHYYTSESLPTMKSKTSKSNNASIETNSSLIFCMKKYKNGSFTQFVFSSQVDKKFQIMGPYGRGLRLNRKSKGFYIIIAAGTGILPFIDLFHFMLQKTLFRLIYQTAGEEVVKQLNSDRVDYHQLDGIKILLIGSFESSKHFYLDNVIKDLYHLNKKHDLNNFNMKLRYSNNESEPQIQMIKDLFDKRFIQQLLLENPDRVYYCGPPSIEKIIRNVQAQGNHRNKFYFL